MEAIENLYEQAKESLNTDNEILDSAIKNFMSGIDVIGTSNSIMMDALYNPRWPYPLKSKYYSSIGEKFGSDYWRRYNGFPSGASALAGLMGYAGGVYCAYLTWPFSLALGALDLVNYHVKDRDIGGEVKDAYVNQRFEGLREEFKEKYGEEELDLLEAKKTEEWNHKNLEVDNLAEAFERYQHFMIEELENHLQKED